MKKLTMALGLLLSISAFADSTIPQPFIKRFTKAAVPASINDASICTTKHEGFIDFEEGESCDLYIPSIDKDGAYTFVFKCENKETETTLKMNAEMGTQMLKEGLNGHYDQVSIRCSRSKEHIFEVKSGEIQKVYSQGTTNRLYIEIHEKYWK
ncbi:MAG: hypothetical protein U0T83_10455 [Bacteriovoracaceae bacterium]